MDDPGFQLGALLMIASEAISARVHAGYVAAGFTDLRPSHDVVFQLLPSEGERVVNLAKRAHTTKQAMGYLVADLEQHGYVERVPDPTDRRAQIVRRTPRGWEVNRLARRVVLEVQAEWAELVGEARLQQVLETLGELAHQGGAVYEGSATQRAAQMDLPPE